MCCAIKTCQHKIIVTDAPSIRLTFYKLPSFPLKYTTVFVLLYISELK